MTEQTTEPTAAQLEEQRVAAEAAAAEKYRAQANPPANDGENPGENEKPQRPSHIPEKFWDAEKGEVRVEELAKSYAELEKQRNKPTEKPAASTPEEQAANAATEAAQAEFTALREATTQTILEHGAPTDEQYAAYEARGFSRSDVDAFIEGQRALGTIRANAVMAEVGGEDNYKALMSWGEQNFKPEEIEVYNRDIASEDEAVRMNAVRGLAARYELANGKLGKSVTAQGGGPSVTSGYTDRSQMIRDMSDPKYQKDESFRQEVARKVQLARAAGVDLR